jgi:glycosyltransferase involved in cell wall biosynthesis
MRICLIITSFTSGGAEMLVANLAEVFSAYGHDIMVLALSDAAQVGNDPAMERAMIAQLEARGITARSLGLRNRRNMVTAGIRLRQALRGLPQDVVHAHTAAALPAVALARSCSTVVLTHHNSRLSFPRWAFRLFDRVVASYVAISEECETVIAAYATRPIRKIMNAANPRFQAASARAAPAKNPVILAVGTISRQKDYPTLIRAARPLAALLASQGRRPRVRIVGGGQDIQTLRALVRDEHAEHLVELLGVRSDISALMRQADLFANSSLWEGYSIAMIEAQMSGLPIVATNVAGNCEMVLPDSNGALVSPSDPDAMAVTIARVLSDDRHYAALSEGALVSAKRFSLEVCAAEHLALYQQVAAEKRSGVH